MQVRIAEEDSVWPTQETNEFYDGETPGTRIFPWGCSDEEAPTPTPNLSPVPDVPPDVDSAYERQFRLHARSLEQRSYSAHMVAFYVLFPTLFDLETGEIDEHMDPEFDENVAWRARGPKWWKSRRGSKNRDSPVDLSATLGTMSPDNQKSSEWREPPPTFAEMYELKEFGEIDPSQLQHLNPATVRLLQARFKDLLWGVDMTDGTLLDFLKTQQFTQKFNIGQFVRDFIFHVIGGGGSVVSYPFYRLFESHRAACGRMFWLETGHMKGLWGVGGFFFITNLLAASVFGMNGLYIYLAREYPEHRPTLQLQLAIADVGVVLRCAVIASKYALMSPYELELFKTIPGVKRQLTYMVLTSWMFLRAPVVRYELDLAKIRLQMDVDNRHIMVFGRHSDDSIPMKAPVVAMVHDVIERSAAIAERPLKIMEHVINLFSLLHFLMPSVFAAIRWQNKDRLAIVNLPGLVYLFFYFASVFCYFAITCKFMLVAFADYFRRFYCLYLWGELLNTNMGDSHMLRLDITDEESILNWLTGRKLLQEFGHRYIYRISSFAYSFLLLLGAVIAYVFVPPLVYHELQTDVIAVLAIDYTLLSLFFLSMIIPGSLANQQMGVDIMRLNNHLHTLEDAILVRGDREKKKSRAAECIKATIEKLTVLDQFYGIRVCGFKASIGLAATLVSFFITISTTLYGIIRENNTKIN